MRCVLPARHSVTVNAAFTSFVEVMLTLKFLIAASWVFSGLLEHYSSTSAGKTFYHTLIIILKYQITPGNIYRGYFSLIL